MKISYIIIGIFWFLFSILIGMQISSWITTTATAITAAYSDSFSMVLYWIGVSSLYLLNIIVIPFFLISAGYKDESLL